MPGLRRPGDAEHHDRGVAIEMTVVDAAAEAQIARTELEIHPSPGPSGRASRWSGVRPSILRLFRMMVQHCSSASGVITSRRSPCLRKASAWLGRSPPGNRGRYSDWPAGSGSRPSEVPLRPTNGESTTTFA
jgi:hypothetical protein